MIAIPFKRPTPINLTAGAPMAFRLSQDGWPNGFTNPRFIVPVMTRGDILLFRCFRTEREAWREAAHWASKKGFDPAPYVEMALKQI